MPYILRTLRSKIDLLLTSYMSSSAATTSGELNYVFTKVALHYLATKGLSYSNLNDIIGALEGAKLELYRRKASIYEDTKASENGDIYE